MITSSILFDGISAHRAGLSISINISSRRSIVDILSQLLIELVTGIFRVPRKIMTEAGQSLTAFAFHDRIVEAALVNMSRAALCIFTPTEVRHRLEFLSEKKNVIPFENTLRRSSLNVVELQM